MGDEQKNSLARETKSRVVRQLALKMEIQFRAETKGTHQLNLRARDESESGAEKNISCMDASKTKVVPERERGTNVWRLPHHLIRYHRVSHCNNTTDVLMSWR